ncbi:hypothetical protein CRX65_26970 [Klebsiella pneumoniae]|nr:hypothetical protein CRX65_26970 [Klebsiella pneumoniae]
MALRLPGLQKRSPDKVRSTAFIASQNSVTNACGMVNRIVNLPDDTSRKIIISSYDSYYFFISAPLYCAPVK